MLHLRGCHPGRIQQALTELPETLDETYERTLREINKANWELAHRLFQCVAVASRPLRVKELAEFLAFDFNAGPTPRFIEEWRLEDPIIAVQSTCRSFLVIIDIGGSQYIQFSHFSVKEFLTSSRLAEANREISRYHVSMTPAHTLVAKACLGILLHLNKDVAAKAWLGTLIPLDENVAEDALKEFPLASYAALHWADHARFEGVSRNVEDGMNTLLDLSKPHLALWVSLHNRELPSWKLFKRGEMPLPRIGTSLHYATICGLHAFVKVLIDEQLHNVDSRDFKNLTALHTASLRGYEQVARVLLECAADVTIQNDDGQTPLHVAAKEGHLQVVRVLLKHGASTSARDSLGSTPLHLALQPRGVDNSHVPNTGAESGAEDEDENRLARLHEALQAGAVSCLFPQEARVQVVPDALERRIHMAAHWQGSLSHMESLHMDTGPLFSHPNLKAEAMARDSHSGHVEVALLLVKHGADSRARNTHGYTPLYFASLNGDMGVVRFLVEHGADLTVKDNEGRTLLHVASNNGHVEVARFLLEHNADPVTRGKSGWTPLHGAAYCGHLQVVQLLVEHGADPTVQSDGGLTPLHLASRNGHVEIVLFLVEHGSDPAAGKSGVTPLLLASYNGHVEIVQFLVDHGGDLTAQNVIGWSPLHLASLFGHVKIVQVLLDHGADMAAQDKGGLTPLHMVSNNVILQALTSTSQALASQKGHVETVQFLLDHGADMTAQDKGGRTPLHFASLNGHANIVQSLLDQGANMAAQDKDGRTPLHFASQSGHVDIVQSLLDHSADMTAQDNDGWTPLLLALRGGHVKIGQSLLDRGADPTAQKKDGWTPLHWASQNGRVEMVQFLVEHGADPAAHVNGWTPLHSASQGGHVETVQFLVEHGADPTALTKGDRIPLNFAPANGQVSIARAQVHVERGTDLATDANPVNNRIAPLHLASYYGHVEVVQSLLDHGADPTVQNKDRQTSLHMASQNGHVEVVWLLIQYGAHPIAQNKYGQTPLHLASQSGHIQIVQFLRDVERRVAAQSRTRIRVTLCLLFLFISTFYAFALLNLGFDEHFRISIKKFIYHTF